MSLGEGAHNSEGNKNPYCPREGIIFSLLYNHSVFQIAVAVKHSQLTIFFVM
jgi:hypothetical protein